MVKQLLIFSFESQDKTCSVVTGQRGDYVPDTRLGVRVKVNPQHPRGEVQRSRQVRSDDWLGGDPDVLLGGEPQPLCHPYQLLAFLLSGVQYEYSVLCPLQLGIIRG